MPQPGSGRGVGGKGEKTNKTTNAGKTLGGTRASYMVGAEGEQSIEVPATSPAAPNMRPFGGMGRATESGGVVGDRGEVLRGPQNGEVWCGGDGVNLGGAGVTPLLDDPLTRLL